MITDTIEKPWRNPVDYLTLVFWVVLFVVVAFAMFDGLRALTMYVRTAAETVVDAVAE